MLNCTCALYGNRAWLDLRLTGKPKRSSFQHLRQHKGILETEKGCCPQIWVGHSEEDALAEKPGLVRGSETFCGTSLLIRGDISNGKRKN